MNIAVAGTGYIGLVTGVCLAHKGNCVTCVDINDEKVNMMRLGKSPIFEPDLEELMQQNMERLNFTTDYQSAYRNAQVIFIGVGTPEKKDGSANLGYVYEVIDQIIEAVNNDCVVVVKSTVPIGTNDKLELYIKKKLKKNIMIDVVSNPEFLSQGTAVRDTLYASRIIIGSDNEKSANIIKQVYDKFDAPKVITDRRSAEMIKYASNDFLALKISYINEIANLCEIVGANVDDVTKGMGFDGRIGSKFLNAGIGYGGSCFPKDTKALNWLASYRDNELKTVKAAIEVNDNQKLKLIKKSRKYYSDLYGLNVAILGLTFKPGTDDLREAPSLVNIPILLDEGCKLNVYDPVGMDNVKKIYGEKLNYCNSIDEALKDTDLCFIFTEWEEIKEYNASMFTKLMNRAIILDGRNCFNLSIIDKYKVIYDSMGRKTICNLDVE